MTPEAERLRLRLAELSPRSAQALILRLVEGRSREDCARLYGIAPEAFDVMLLRAAKELAGQVSTAPYQQELSEAKELAAALSNGVRTGLAAHLEPLAEHRAEVKQRIEAAEREAERSVARRREDWIRRILVLLIIALTAYFYVSRPPEAPPLRPAAPSAP